MNLKYLGDALDHWKGSLFETLQGSGALRDFAVDAMASDWCEWKPDDISLFAQLLRVSKSQIIGHSVSLTNRVKYFAEIQHSGDLFFDPDTGIRTGRVSNISQYIQPNEIAQFMHEPERIVVVYQHARGQVSRRVHAVCKTISACHWCSYESGTVAMIFFSRSRDRLAQVAAHFAGLLGRHANKRIRMSWTIS